MNAPRAALALGWLWLGFACASQPAPRVVSAKALEPDLAQAHELAPDYTARVQAAEAAAVAEPTLLGRGDQLQRASLLREAARAEAERIALTRTVQGFERRIEQATLARATAERALIALRATRARDDALQLERIQAARVFASLVRAAEQEPKERDLIWGFLLRRAQAVLAVAQALGAATSELDGAALQLTAARTASLPNRVRLGQRALLGAHSALGNARARAPSASATEQLDLADRLRERGFEARASELGQLTVELAQTAGQGELRRRFALLAELLPAFPHGPIVLTCGRQAAAAYTGCEPAAWLFPAERARVRVQPSPAELPPRAVRLALPAYGPTAK